MSNGVQGNYLSDAAILAWVAEQQNAQYGQLKGAMDFETTRSEMLQDLATLKEDMRQAGGDNDKLATLDEHIKAFQEKYGEISEFESVNAAIDEYAEQVAPKADELATTKARQEAWDALPAPEDPDNDQRGDRPTEPEPFSKDDMKAWADALQPLADGENHNEQLAMIRINELKSTIDHSAEMASQLIKSSNDTSAFAINNIA